jgi:hypothetical protein
MPAGRDPWPNDSVRAVAVVAVLVCEIRQSDEDERRTLLMAFERAAWPTHRSQAQ